MEIWKNVIGYEELYQISNLGRVKSKDNYRNGINGFLKKYHGKLLKGCVNNLGYVCFDLYKEGVRKNIKGHYLVAFHFVEGYKKGLWINHKDGRKINNSYVNLEWCTAKENCIHAFKNRLIVRHGKIVLNLRNGIFYDSIRDAHRSSVVNCSRSHFQKQLSLIIENSTDFMIV